MDLRQLREVLSMVLRAAPQQTAIRATAHGDGDGVFRHTSPTISFPTHTAAPEPLLPPTNTIAANPTSNTRRRLRPRRIR